MPTDDLYVQNLLQNDTNLWRCLSNFPTMEDFFGCSTLIISRGIWQSNCFRHLSWHLHC